MNTRLLSGTTQCVILFAAALVNTALGAEPMVVRSVRSGAWSDGKTWDSQAAPAAGVVVKIQEGHHVTYDVESEAVIRSVHVAGELEFARDRNTRLDVGLIRIEGGAGIDETGFDCVHEPKAHHAHSAAHEHEHPAASKNLPALLVGTLDAPIPASHRATIRLHAVPGMDPKSCPAIVCCGGRMDFHGAPLSQTWAKLGEMARAGEPRVVLPYPLEGWNVGDRVIVVGTSRQVGYLGTRKIPTDDTILSKHTTEVRTITKMLTWGSRGPGSSSAQTTQQIVELDRPLDFEHRALGEYRAEVANLSRNVVVESADPHGVRGHTMYHRNSQGGISYAEFRHLGKRDVLGRYPIHFHLVGETMRGSSVVGASVWDSHNRWVTIHGTQYLVVRDCVGFQSIGHGFFLEDGTEAFNVLDGNLAVLACRGKPLPEQVLPYDHNLGSGFWWANNLNTFTRNVAAECDEDGFRFEAVKSPDFDPVLNVHGPDGQRTSVDVRTLPFVRFEDNEAHTHRLFAMNLGGFSTLQFFKPHSDVGGVGPDARHPLVIRNLKVWDTHWGFHTSCPRVRIEGAEFYDCLYGMFRCVLDGHEHKDVHYVETRNPLFFPQHAGTPSTDNGRPYPEDPPVDDLPPTTVITRVEQLGSHTLRVRGTTAENYAVKGVFVNDAPVRPLRPNFAEWEIELHEIATPAVQLTARAEDASGNLERKPHAVEFRLRSTPSIESAER